MIHRGGTTATMEVASGLYSAAMEEYSLCSVVALLSIRRLNTTLSAGLWSDNSEHMALIEAVGNPNAFSRTWASALDEVRGVAADESSAAVASVASRIKEASGCGRNSMSDEGATYSWSDWQDSSKGTTKSTSPMYIMADCPEGHLSFSQLAASTVDSLIKGAMRLINASTENSSLMKIVCSPRLMIHESGRSFPCFSKWMSSNPASNEYLQVALRAELRASLGDMANRQSCGLFSLKNSARRIMSCTTEVDSICASSVEAT
eukprot:Gregarina_sp_Pseudo_9__5283@NODE_609_length_2496_cov_6_613350_g575_i0_p3_GENE_NODE_609_length_2496_cov_6_613350_g575_i0NODE_609_length_2496_cov_6_613350_g575_i0_p3_ORF_typecomplete_len262_score5_19Tape_meas_lam_C/PF09718_10/1_2e03Tape_meas_lam_C/PF09718_10/1_6e02Tape_meas_lam_C/PF09718_10/1_6_NODE_609_length_2496_cov_6_613350_g575_i015162301